MAITKRLRPSSFTNIANWGFASGSPAVDQINDANDATLIRTTDTVHTDEFETVMATMPAALAVTKVVLGGRYRAQGADVHVRTRSHRVKLNGTVYYSPSTFNLDDTTLTFVDYTWDLGATAPDGAGWTAARINAATWGGKGSPDPAGTAQSELADIWADVTYVPVPTAEEPSREVLARLVWEQSHRPRKMVFVGRPQYLDLELADLVDVSDVDGEEAAGLGWGMETHQRRVHEVQAQDLDLDRFRVTLELQDVRYRMLAFYESGMAKAAGAPDYPGALRLDVGATRLFTRDTPAWVEDLTDGFMKQCAPGTEAYGKNGMVLERSSTCWFPRCALRDGITGLTLNGTGSHSSAIALDTAETWFDPSVIASSLKFTASSSPGGDPDLEAVWPTSPTITAGTVGKISIRRKDGAAHVLYYWLKRGVDNKYWRESDQTWQAAKTWNAMSAATTRARYTSKTVSVGASGTTLTLGVGLPAASASASQVNWVYKVQGESLPWASSDIVCQDAVQSRNAAQLVLSNNSGARTVPADQGSWTIRFVPNFNSADVSGYTFWLPYCSHTADTQALGYDGTNQQFILKRVVGGTPYTAVFPIALTAGQVYDITPRWTGTDGALGQAAYSLSLVVNAVVGAAVTAAALNETATASLAFYNGGDYPDGALSYVAGLYFPMTDAEATGRVPL